MRKKTALNNNRINKNMSKKLSKKLSEKLSEKLDALFANDYIFDVIVELCNDCKLEEVRGASESLEQIYVSDCNTLVLTKNGFVHHFKIIMQHTYTYSGHRVHVRALEEVKLLPDACVVSSCERRIVSDHCTKMWKSDSTERLDIVCFTSVGKVVQTYRGKNPIQWLKKINICTQ
jgi:hypothetical protein